MASELSGIRLEMQIWGRAVPYLWDPFHFWIISHIIALWDFVRLKMPQVISHTHTHTHTHTHPMQEKREWAGFPPFSAWRNWGSEPLSDLSQGSQWSWNKERNPSLLSLWGVLFPLNHLLPFLSQGTQCLWIFLLFPGSSINFPGSYIVSFSVIPMGVGSVT